MACGSNIKEKIMNEQVLIIDPQIDFCDPSGALYVQNAEHDMARAAKIVREYGSNISKFHVTLDSHHNFDVAHPLFWVDSQGNHPAPFTIITKDDVVSGKWTPTKISLQKRMVDYLDAIESQGKYPLCVWPPHCLIGSDGHKVVPELFDALSEWELTNTNMVNYVTKGTNPFTEHYSAVKAEVVDPQDPTTQVNTSLVEIPQTADKLYVLGEAGSHCVANTLRDFLDAIGDPSFANKISLVTDCMSPVVGAIDFTPQHDKFISDMVNLGVNTTTSDELIGSTTLAA